MSEVSLLKQPSMISSPAGFRLVVPWAARRLLLVLLLLPALAACGGDKNAFPPPCPRASIVGDAADLTRFRPGAGGQDLTDMVVDGRITGVAGKCARGDDNTVEVTATVSMELMRGPAMRGRSEAVPFFVAVVSGQRILDKQPFRLPAEFPANIDRVRVTSNPVRIALPVESGKSAADYELMVGFQLTPEELAMNRRRGPR